MPNAFSSIMGSIRLRARAAGKCAGLAVAGAICCGAPRNESPTESPATRDPGRSIDRSACPAHCTGTAPQPLIGAIQARARVAKRCYESALRRQPNLEGRLLVTLQLGDDGQPCRVWVSSGSMAVDDGFSRCLERVLDVRYPAPAGGCVDAVLPLSFERETDELKNRTPNVDSPTDRAR